MNLQSPALVYLGVFQLADRSASGEFSSDLLSQYKNFITTGDIPQRMSCGQSNDTSSGKLVTK